MQQGINSGIFPNQYEFEAALASLLYAAHDRHVNLIAGILAAFSFASPYDIVSVSIDGLQIPKVYLAIDLDTSNFFASYTPSAIASINGIDATAYLQDFAANNSFSTLSRTRTGRADGRRCTGVWTTFLWNSFVFLFLILPYPIPPMSELRSRWTFLFFVFFLYSFSTPNSTCIGNAGSAHLAASRATPASSAAVRPSTLATPSLSSSKTAPKFKNTFSAFTMTRSHWPTAHGWRLLQRLRLGLLSRIF